MDLQANMEILSPRVPLPRIEVKKNTATARELLNHLDIKGSDKVLFQRNRLISRDYTLCNIDINAAAVVEDVNLLSMAAAAYREAPIVVDINKFKIGAAPGGYTPKVIVIEGSARHEAAQLSGKGKILAWVGAEAMKELYGAINTRQLCSQLQASGIPVKELYPYEACVVYSDGRSQYVDYFSITRNGGVKLSGTPHKITAIAKTIAASGMYKKTQLHFKMEAAMMPTAVPGPNITRSAPPMATTPPTAVPGPVSSNPTMRPVGPTAIPGRTAIMRGGCHACMKGSGGHSCDDGMSAAKDNWKAARKMGWKMDKGMMGTAPPGHEDQVMKLKEKYGEDSSIPFKIAWSDYGDKNKGKKKNMDAMRIADMAHMPKMGDASLQSPGSGNGPRMKTQVKPGMKVRPGGMLSERGMVKKIVTKRRHH